ncbi:hypothetical protein ACVWZW_008868 [Bradyrhizobium sp. F1.13.4]
MLRLLLQPRLQPVNCHPICSAAKASFPRSPMPSRPASRSKSWSSAAVRPRIPASEDASYPARMQAILKDKLPPSEAVHVSVEIQSKKTAEEAAASFVKLMEAKAPTLVIWQTGTVDAIRAIDPDDFRGAVTEGVVALQKAGADVVLMNLQYSPRTETMISAPPYLDNMRVVAQEHDIPLFDRFAIMRQWNDQGQFDLFSPSRGPELAKQVHDCLGRALAQFVIDAAHLEPAQQQN